MLVRVGPNNEFLFCSMRFERVCFFHFNFVSSFTAVMFRHSDYFLFHLLIYFCFDSFDDGNKSNIMHHGPVVVRFCLFLSDRKMQNLGVVG